MKLSTTSLDKYISPETRIFLGLIAFLLLFAPVGFLIGAGLDKIYPERNSAPCKTPIPFHLDTDAERN